MRAIFSLQMVCIMALTTFSGTAMASHYLLEDVSFISPEERTVLEALKIEATEDLLREVISPQAREALSKRSKISVERLVVLSNMVDLLQIRGIGPKMVLLFQAAGYPTAAALAAAKLEALHSALSTTNDTQHISEVLPSKEQVDSWRRAASKVPVRLIP